MNHIHYTNKRSLAGVRDRDFSMARERVDTRIARKRYDRVARFYDLFTAPMEYLRFSGWRERLKNRVVGKRVMEVGVGTGKNFPFYPSVIRVTAVDFSQRMMDRGRKKAAMIGLNVEPLNMNVQNLMFPDQTFNTVFSTFVFCSVPDPVRGLQEMRRVCKLDGRLILLEHMRPENSLLGLFFDLINPLIVRMIGANINRRTMENIEKAGWRVTAGERLAGSIVRWIEAKPQ
jgi:ubiquinone/menaquinone biosynthesis C-methylase UbiE